MADTLGSRTTTHVAEVVRHGDRLLVPEKMSYASAIDLLVRRQEYEEQTVKVNRRFDVRWEEGAVALEKVLTARYGWSPNTHSTQETMFGGKEKVAPEQVSIEVAYGEHKTVPWGSFLIPGTEATLDMEVYDNPTRFGLFAIVGTVKRKWQGEVDALFESVAEELRQSSIYKGKAWSITGGDSFQPHFVDTDCDPSQLIFSKPVWDAIETSVFTPIVRYADLKASGLPFKRGVGLVGDFGTGKTLAARVASHLAVKHGVTFIICKEAASIAVAVEYARAYQPAVVFVEDIDRELEGDRDDAMDLVLNTIDGIDGKKAEVMIVYTSNNVAAIHKAALRPGRTDAVIEVTAPDAEAVERLIRYYGKGVISADEDITEAATLLEGRIPAVIAEVVKRAKLAMLKLTPVGERVKSVTAEALTESATTMKLQLDLLYGEKDHVKPVTIETIVHDTVKRAFNGHIELTEKIASEVGVAVR